MTIVKAKLKKLKTDDGMVEILPDIPLGKIYFIDLDSKRILRAYNIEFHQMHSKESVQDVSSGGWLPMELLEIVT